MTDKSQSDLSSMYNLEKNIMSTNQNARSIKPSSERDRLYTSNEREIDTLNTGNARERDELYNGNQSLFHLYSKNSSSPYRGLESLSRESDLEGCATTSTLPAETNPESNKSTPTPPAVLKVSGMVSSGGWKLHYWKREKSVFRRGYIKLPETVTNKEESSNRNLTIAASFTSSLRDRISLFRGKSIKKLGKIFIHLHHNWIIGRCEMEDRHQMHLNDRISIQNSSEKRRLKLDQARKDALIVKTDEKLFGRELLLITDENRFPAVIEVEILNRPCAISAIEIEACSNKIPVHLFINKVVEEHGTVVFCISTCLICLKFLTLLKDSEIKHLVLRLDKMGVYGDGIYYYLQDKFSRNLPSNVYFHGTHPEFVRKCFSVIEKNTTNSDAVIGLFPDAYDLIVIGGTSLGLQTVFEARFMGLRVCLIQSSLKPAEPQPLVILGKEFISEPNVSKKILCHLMSLRYRAAKYGGDYRSDSFTDIHSDWKELVESARNLTAKIGQNRVTSIHNVGAGFLRCGVKFVDRHTIEITNSTTEKYRLRSSYFILANPMHSKIPLIPGSEYCISPDQLFSLPNTPGKTLIYGATRTAIEYAGLLGGLGFPVTIMAQSKIMEEYDSEMVKCIIDNIKNHGVTIINDCVLTAVELLADHGDKYVNQNIRSDESLYKFAWSPDQTRLIKKKKGPRRGRFARHCGIDRIVESTLLEWNVSPTIIETISKAGSAMRKLEALNGVDMFDTVSHNNKLEKPEKQQASVERRFVMTNVNNARFSRLGLKSMHPSNVGKNPKDGRSINRRQKRRNITLLGVFLRLFLASYPDEKTMDLLDFNKKIKTPVCMRNIDYRPHYSYNPRTKVGVHFPGGTAQRLSKNSKYIKYLEPIPFYRNSDGTKMWPYSEFNPTKDEFCINNSKTSSQDIEYEIIDSGGITSELKNMCVDKIIQDYNSQYNDIVNNFKSRVVSINSSDKITYNLHHKSFEDYILASLQNIDKACKQVSMITYKINYNSQGLTVIKILAKVVQTIQLFHLYIYWKINQYKTISRKYSKYQNKSKLMTKMKFRIIRKKMFNLLINLESILAFTFVTACNAVMEGSKGCITDSKHGSNTGSSLEIVTKKSSKRTRGIKPQARKSRTEETRKKIKIPFKIPQLYENRIKESCKEDSTSQGILNFGSTTNRSPKLNKNVNTRVKETEISKNVLVRLRERNANEISNGTNTRRKEKPSNINFPFNIPKLHINNNVLSCKGGSKDLINPMSYINTSTPSSKGILNVESTSNQGPIIRSSVYKLNSEDGKFEPSPEIKKNMEISTKKPEMSENVFIRIQEKNVNKISNEKDEKSNRIVHRKDSFVSKNITNLSDRSLHPWLVGQNIENLRIRGIRSDVQLTELMRLEKDRTDLMRHPSRKIIVEYDDMCKKSVSNTRIHNQMTTKSHQDTKIKCNFRNFVAINFGRQYELKCSLSQRNKYLSSLAIQSDAKAKGFKPIKWRSLATHQKRFSRDRNTFLESLKQKQKSTLQNRSELSKYKVCYSTANLSVPTEIKEYPSNTLVNITENKKEFEDSSSSRREKYGCICEQMVHTVDHTETSKNCIKNISQNKIKSEDITLSQCVTPISKPGTSSSSPKSKLESDKSQERINSLLLERNSPPLIFGELSQTKTTGSLYTLLDLTESCSMTTEICSQQPKHNAMEDGVLQTDGASRKFTKKGHFQMIENKSLRRRTQSNKQLKKEQRLSLNRIKTILEQLCGDPSEETLKHGVIQLDGREPMVYQLDKKLKRVCKMVKSFSQILGDLKQYLILVKIVKLFKLKESPGRKIFNEAVGFEPQLFPGHSVYKVKGKFIKTLDDFKENFNTIIVARSQLCPAQDIQFNDVGVSTCPFNGKIYTNSLDQTTVATIYAIGECAYGWLYDNFSSINAAQYLVRRLFTDFEETPEGHQCISSVNTFPLHYAFVGLCEEEAREKYRNVVTYIASFPSLPQPFLFSNNEADSILKLICRIEAGGMEKVVGIHFYNEKASFIVQGYAAALKKGLYYEELRDSIAMGPINTDCIPQFNMVRKHYVNPLIESNAIKSNASSQDESVFSNNEQESVCHFNEEEDIESLKGEEDLISHEILQYDDKSLNENQNYHIQGIPHEEETSEQLEETDNEEGHDSNSDGNIFDDSLLHENRFLNSG